MLKLIFVAQTLFLIGCSSSIQNNEDKLQFYASPTLQFKSDNKRDNSLRKASAICRSDATKAAASIAIPTPSVDVHRNVSVTAQIVSSQQPQPLPVPYQPRAMDFIVARELGEARGISTALAKGCVCWLYG